MKKPVEFQIALVGNTRVGKTTIAASMVDALQERIDSANTDEVKKERENPRHKPREIRLKPSDQTRSILVDKREKLRSLSADNSPKVETVDIDGFSTANPSEYTFEIDVDTSVKDGTDIRMVFYDPPGGYYNMDGVVSKVKEAIEKSSMLVLAVHTPAMVQNSEHHTKINIPDRIEDALRKIDPKKIGALLFALVRSEKYVKQPDGLQQLVNATRESYRGILNWAASKGIECYVCPVLTLGNIEFVRFKEFDKSENGWIEEYIKIAGGYAPKNCDAPLFLALIEAIRLALGHPANQKGLIDIAGELLGLPWLTAKARNVFAMRRLLNIFDPQRASSPLIKLS